MQPWHGTGDYHISEHELAARIKDLGTQITNDYTPEGIHVIGILTGSFVFLADLIRHLKLPMTVSFIQASSYRGEFEPGAGIAIHDSIDRSVSGRDVLLVDDIVDTGRTVATVRNEVLSAGARTVRIAALLQKTDRRQEQISVDYAGFDATGKYVYGFGLDRANEDRNLPFITSVNLKEE